MWKTTARYAEMQRTKLAEQENKLKQVYIPNYNKPNPNLVGSVNTTNEPINIGCVCESCKTESSINWFSWGPAHLSLRLCNDCWISWKKHGGLKKPHEFEAYDLDGSADMTVTRSGQNRNAVCLKTNLFNQLCLANAWEHQWYFGQTRSTEYHSGQKSNHVLSQH